MRLLNEIKPSLPVRWYYDEGHYQKELDAIWYRDWVCVGRSEDIPDPGDYFLASVGNQDIIVTRAADGRLRAFHNTCRHRGSLLCQEARGKFRNARIICPYHTWTYSTDGDLLATPGRFETADFRLKDFSLYSVHLDCWGGFIFLNLATEPAQDLPSFLGDETDYLANWPLEAMRSVHQEEFDLHCNWKIFWENYSECYHCPRVHPELCKVMPVYKHAVFDPMDVPGWTPAFDGDTGLAAVGPGLRTWTLDGQSDLPDIPGPTPEERDNGVIFASVPGSMYVVGHPDYVRAVRILPQGPERTRLLVDWLLPADNPLPEKSQLEDIIALARLVVEQDGEVCELNQRGLHSAAHDVGVLVPQEFELWLFHEWLRGRLDAAGYGDR